MKPSILFVTNAANWPLTDGKRQRTWFRGHMKDWISIFHPNFDILTKKIVKLVTSS